ncbi:GNAT family protein [Mucilaginibacter gynuensis]|uniref:GNAT family protein n=1 Tax=Mucilaginibacter gynuensis TaxID=1302236 RepID=A0ABP8G275_9SPHI
MEKPGQPDILLKPLTEADSEAFYDLYALPQLQQSFGGSPFLPGETPVDFTRRIIASCFYIRTIRASEAPERIIGDCALHHHNPAESSVEIGGVLHPDYSGRSVMRKAFILTISFAGQIPGCRMVRGITRKDNLQAIRLCEKLGFVKQASVKDEVVMIKFLP